jgi:hypothetical protein
MSGAVTAIATAVSAVAANTAAVLGASSAVIEGVSSASFALASLGVTTGIAAGIGAAFAPKVPDPAALQTPLKQPMPVRQSAFGRVRVAGAYAYYGTGTVGAATHLSIDILALLDGRSDKMVSFFLHDDLMAPVGDYWSAPGAPGKYGGGGSNPPNLVQMDYRLGLATETSFSEIEPALDLWDANHRGDGVTTGAVYCTPARREDQQGDFPNGVPIPSWVFDSQLIYDPRDVDQTQGDPLTYVYSDNPVLALLAYLTDAEGGMGLDYDRFILPAIDYWKDAADECDGLIATSGMHATLLDAADAGDNKIFVADQTGLSAGSQITLPDGQTVTVSGLATAGEVDLTGTLTNAHSAGELVYWPGFGQAKIYRCAGTYRHDTPPGDVVKSILQTFDGWMMQRGDGALVVRTNTVYTPTVTLGDDHILGYQVQHFLPDEQVTNQYVVSYTDPAAAFNKAEAGYVEDDDDIGARGVVRSNELYLQWVPSAPQALTVARSLLARSTQPLRGVMTCNLAGLGVMGERFVKLQISELDDLTDIVVEVTGKPTIDLASMTVSFPWVAATGTITPPTPPPVPARVQEAASWNSRGATFGSAPTDQSVMVALFTGPDAAAPVNTADGWTLLDGHEGIVTTGGPDDTIWGVLAWKRAGASESAAQTPFTGSVTNNQDAVCMIEIENCGDLPGALESLQWASPASPGSAHSATASTTSANDDDFAVAMGGWYYVWPYWGQLHLTGVNAHITSSEGVITTGSSSTIVGSLDVPTAGTAISATIDNALPGYHILLALLVFSRNVRDTLPPLGPPSGAPLQPLDAPTITSVTPDYLDSGGGVQGARLLIETSDEGDVAWKVRWKLSADMSWTEITVTDPTGSPPELLTGLIAASGSIDVQVAYITATQVSPWSATTTASVAAATPAGLVTSTSKSANFTTTAADSVYYVDTASAAITVTLNASPALNEIVEVWDATGHAGTNPISLAGNGKNIAGVSSVTSAVQINYGKITLIYDGTQWLAS